MLGGVSGEIISGNSVPLPAGFTADQCIIICSIAQSRATSYYSRSYTWIELIKNGRVLTSNYVYSGTNVIVSNEGSINYLVFGRTSNEMMNFISGIIQHGQTIPAPTGVFTSSYYFVSLASLKSDTSYIGLKYFTAVFDKNTRAVTVYGVREDLTSHIPGAAYYAGIGKP